jgi:hypothetical protein
MIFTPSYYGTSADVRAIAEICHDRDVPLVTDDAWGLDYALSGHPDLPEGALAQGAPGDRLGAQDAQRPQPDVGALSRLGPDRHRTAEPVL